MNKLSSMRVYLCGPMDRVKDGGRGWRDMLTPKLQEMKVVVLDPCNKPLDGAYEGPELRERHTTLLAQHDFETVANEVKVLRRTDLRMVDIADFLIVHLNNNVQTCGTYEELFWANRMKKPVLVMCEQGKLNVPRWLFGVLPHQHIFNNWQELIQYLHDVDEGRRTESYNRWVFFNQSKI